MSNTILLSYEKWCSYININKLSILDTTNKSLLIDNSQEHYQFITIFKKIFNINIFNVSRISYAIFIYLDTYIDKYLINIINNNNNPDKIENKTPEQKNTNTDNTENDNDNDNNNKIILNLIIQFSINIEFILNTQLFFIIYILNKNTTTNTTTTTNNKNNITGTNILENKPHILLNIEKICNEINVNIKSSTIILLLLKLNTKLCNNNIIDLIKNDLIKNEIECCKIINICNEKINTLLDNFFINITQCISQSQNITYKYILCVKYILELTQLLYTIFNTLFNVFIKYLLKSYPLITDLNNITININTLLQDEIVILNTKLLAT